MTSLNNISIFICLSFIVFGCVNKQTEKKNGKNNINNDTRVEKKYQPVDNDSSFKEKELSIYNQPYKLKIVKYCLNDSNSSNEIMIINPNGIGTRKMSNISHNYFVNIILTKDNNEVFKKQITKETFMDSLDAKFYKKAVLREIEYNFVRTNRLYFKAILAIPETDLTSEMTFAIFYQTKKIGQLDFW